MARSVAALALSIAVHAAVIGAQLASGPDGADRGAPAQVRSFAPGVRARFEGALRGAALRERRADLVRRARADLAAGRLELGRFLLDAGRIDAEAAGMEVDSDLAGARYRERVSALRARLSPAGPRAAADRGRSGGPAQGSAPTGVVAAVPEVFRDLRYHGRPGGLMASALLDGGGSCEQVTQLVAAAVYDAGRRDEIALRYYGGVMEDGAAHVTPVALVKSGEIDLMTGLPSAPGGLRLAPEELVEVYARAHGLAPRIAGDRTGAPRSNGQHPAGTSPPEGGATRAAAAAKPSAPPGDASSPPRPTLLAGFPQNGDRYPGSLPLYASSAVRDPQSDPAIVAGAEDVEIQAMRCALSLRVAMLAPPALEIATGPAGALLVEPRRVPLPVRLERQSVLLRAAETFASRAGVDPVDRLMGWACLAVLGPDAALDFALASEPALAAEAALAGRRGRENGERALAAIAWSGEEGERAARKIASDYNGRSWVLLALEGGDRVVLDLAIGASRDDWGRMNALGALVVWPPTRERALAFVPTLSVADQIAVMHEVFHAHDHLAPWASSFDLGGTPAADAGAARFLQVYRVFRRLAWGLWEGRLPVPDILAELERDARAAPLDRGWEAGLLEYLATNALGLHASRPGGKVVVSLLRAAVERNPADSLDPLRRRLAYLDAQASLDARTLADANRLR